MKKYTKLIILSVVLVVIIAVITLAMVFDFDLILFKNLSIAGIQNKKVNVQGLMVQQILEEQNNLTEKNNLQNSKNSFDVAKEEYENIDDSTIEQVREATKEEAYFIEYLWVVLGNYATANNVDISIITPGSTVANDTTNNTANAAGATGGSETETEQIQQNQMNTSTSLNSGIKITVQGRYANVADFVFDVENDKSLRFKLDNIKMEYSGDNEIKATFDVLSLAVTK